ncbi:PASTA domain-containing protein [Gemmatimonas sp.]|uniref:PASTA domain-containing protein n=1 Tax=Gemmatimonas sp. TaxID=1962908 RepID=UPI00398389D0
MAAAKQPGTRAPRGPMSKATRTWLIRGAVAALAGLIIGGAGGVVTVRTLEPGRANAVDSVQAVLDSIARGTIPEPTAAERDQESKRQADSASQAIQSADSAAKENALLPVPDVVGLEEGPARDKLLEAGLLVGDVQFRASTSPAGIVLATTPPAGSLLAASGTVSLVISDGRSPADTLLPPQLDPAP